tara:strand:+ start:13416 stop:13706 length:291 start_codon:yes stop_codon:yes gene_type:complete
MADNKQKGAGKVHTTSAQEPECQHEKGHHTDEHEACKPDFDEKDSNISPSRKAAGPNLRTLNRSADPEGSPSEQAPEKARPPEAKIKDDLPPEPER